MPFDVVLPIFPPGSLDSSIITTTWIGIFIVAFFNLRFGWVLSGLIVPGYLVPLILIKPWAAAVILLESVVTYLLVWTYSEVAPAGGRVHSLFGRDRFFALVLVSVLVRLLFDGWALPHLGAWMNEALNIHFDYRNNLQSFGLIIIALLANQYWKTGIRGAVIPVTVTIGLTLLITRYVLMEFTNFRISDIGYLYEDVAASILASPKAYIILITTAFIASRMNLHYGWEYNGILIPALLAMQWFQPIKILTSLAEALVIYALAVALLRSPLLANRNIEGARKLVLFFNVGFAWKMLLGWLIPIFQPEWKSSDFFGFGYLLSTLIALKVHDKGILARLTRATLQTSVTGVVFATAIGFSLVLLSQRPIESVFTSAVTEVREVPALPGNLREVLEAEKILLYSTTRPGSAPSASEAEIFRVALERVGLYLETNGPLLLLVEAQQLFGQVGYEVAWVEGRYLLIREQPQLVRRGWGSYLLDTKNAYGLLLELPDPLEMEGLTEAATLLMNALGGRGLAIAGFSRHRTPAGGLDVLREFGTFYQVFHRAFGGTRVLQLRGYTPASRRALRLPGEEAGSVRAQIWIKGRLPPGLDLVRMQQWMGAFTVQWGEPRLPNVQSASAAEGFAQLFLDHEQIRALRFRSLLAEQTPTDVSDRLTTTTLLENRLLLAEDVIAGPATERYRQPTMPELLFADVELLTPLINRVKQSANGTLDSGADIELLSLDRAAVSIGMELRVFTDAVTGGQWLILGDPEPPASRHLGTYVFRLNARQPVALQVPRPRYERNTVSAALELFRSMEACCLFVAGAHAWANADGSADPVRSAARQSLFNLVSQVFLREVGPQARLVVQVRGFSDDESAPVTEADRVLAVHNGAISPQQLTPLAGAFHSVLAAREGVTLLAGAQGAEDSRFGIGRLQQAAYLDATDAGEFAVLWLSSDLRRAYRDADVSDAAAQQFHALSLPVHDAPLDQWMASRPRQLVFAPDPSLRTVFGDYVVQRDILLLASLRAAWSGTLHLVQDENRGESFVVFESRSGRIAAIARLREVPGMGEGLTLISGAAQQLRFPAGSRWMVFQ